MDEKITYFNFLNWSSFIDYWKFVEVHSVESKTRVGFVSFTYWTLVTSYRLKFTLPSTEMFVFVVISRRDVLNSPHIPQHALQSNTFPPTYILLKLSLVPLLQVSDTAQWSFIQYCGSLLQFPPHVSVQPSSQLDAERRKKTAISVFDSLTAFPQAGCYIYDKQKEVDVPCVSGDVWLSHPQRPTPAQTKICLVRTQAEKRGEAELQEDSKSSFRLKLFTVCEIYKWLLEKKVPKAHEWN